jgi:hypothetical protein
MAATSFATPSPQPLRALLFATVCLPDQGRQNTTVLEDQTVQLPAEHWPASVSCHHGGATTAPLPITCRTTGCRAGEPTTRCGARHPFHDTAWGSPRTPQKEEAMHDLMAPAEVQRLAALTALEILDTAPEERFDRITGLARRIFGVPMAAITFIAAERQWVKSGTGIEYGMQIPRHQSICHHTIAHDTTMVVENTLLDTRISTIPMVREEPRIRFYAGHPLHAPTGEPVGTLCIADIITRQLTTHQGEILADLARMVEQELTRTPAPLPIHRSPVSSVAAQAPGWEITGRSTPERQALGGFYDWHLSENHLHLRAADVTGEPLTVTEASAWVDTLLPPEDHCPAQGSSLYRRPGTENTGSAASPTSFVTAFTARLDRHSSHLTYVQLGYGLAVILQPDGGHRRLEPSGVPLGLPTATQPRINTTTLAPGEILVVLNDGFLQLQASPQWVADQVLVRLQRNHGHRLDAHNAMQIATAWAVAQGHCPDLTILAARRT